MKKPLLEERHNQHGNACVHWQKHRMTCEEFDDLYARSQGLCEVCGIPEAETARKKLYVDHYEDDEVIYVRGLVCARCNSVMSAVDGNNSWGPKRLQLRKEAELYAASPWQQPRKKNPKPKPKSPSDDYVMLLLPRDPFAAVEELAKNLRRRMTREQIEALLEHLK